MPRKRVKLGRKSKQGKGDKSKIVDIDEDQQTKKINKTPGETHLLDLPTCVKKRKKSAKQVHVAFLPEKYEPLVEDEITDRPREANVKKRQDKYKKFRKNVGKALRYSWKCLVVGLQNVSLGYSMPVSAIVPEIYRARSHP
ncbi:required for drug-induced death protein 1 [Triplophysa dalaica]|uniref:required for drug-induced death protein 1 n=1 Tax=Triplophysa dalaica TaxID=1582913 RepID=UPI0024DF7EF7|nr:required for drug-induced death protein 1 [Triplophysa dalaica]